MIKVRKFAPLVLLSASLLLLAACKLTTNGGSLPSGPSGGSAQYLFASSNGQVWSFSIDATTGALGSPTSVGGPASSYGVAANPTGTNLYVADAANDAVDVYSISSSGVLSQISGSPFSVGTPPGGTATAAAGLALDATGKYLYVADFANDALAGFSVNSSTGSLTSLGSPIATPAGPAQIAIDSTNNFVYVSDFSSSVGGISAFTLNGSSGALSPVSGSSPFNTVLGGGPFGLATAGSYLYAAENSSIANSVAGLAITSGTGGLSLLPGSPFPTGAPSGNEAAGIAVSPSGKFLYVANSTEGSISAYSIDATTGVLTALSGSPITVTSDAWSLVIDSTGSFLYASNPNEGTITGFNINSTTGALTQFSGAATAAGTATVPLTITTVSN